MPATRSRQDHLLALGDAVARRGVAANRPAVDALVARARARGVGSVLVEILEDRAAPEVVHQRALGRLLVAMAVDGQRRPGEGALPPRRRQRSAA
jgi:hypothetical protein